MSKIANTSHPVHELIAMRWSPCAFSDEPVSEEDLRSLFEAVRWAPSAYNEQPWRYIVATRRDPEEFERLLSCLVEANQAWARDAFVLALSVASMRFAHNGKENPLALHDLGLAASNLCLEATARGLMVHQMAGILPDRVRSLYRIPKDFQAVTGLAIGRLGQSDALPESLKQRDFAPRVRKPQKEFVFGKSWERPAGL